MAHNLKWGKKCPQRIELNHSKIDLKLPGRSGKPQADTMERQELNSNYRTPGHDHQGASLKAVHSIPTFWWLVRTIISFQIQLWG